MDFSRKTGNGKGTREESGFRRPRKGRDRIDKSRAIGAVPRGAWYGDMIKRTFYTHRSISINMQRR